jgi:hypothetical protein
MSPITRASTHATGEGVVLARLQQSPTGLFAQKKAPISDFQADLRPDGLPINTLVNK